MKKTKDRVEEIITMGDFYRQIVTTFTVKLIFIQTSFPLQAILYI